MSREPGKREVRRGYDARRMIRATSCRSLCLVLAVLLGAGCPHKGEPPRAPSGRPLVPVVTRIRIANAEARRGGGLDELIELATTGEPAVRALALRGLGRVGGARALSVLRGVLAGRDPYLVEAAANAIAVNASLSDDQTGNRDDTNAIRGAEATGTDSKILIEALGRAGDTFAFPYLSLKVNSGVDQPDLSTPEQGELAALAAGRLGRRKIALDAELRTALVRATASRSPRVRWAATYAFAREQLPDGEEPDPAIAAALVARLADPDAAVRAIAVSALGKRKLVVASRDALIAMAGDPDWKVAVEVARALGGPDSDDTGRDALAGAIATWLPKVAAEPPFAHPVMEAVRGLATKPLTERGVAAITTIASARWDGIPDLTRGWIECLATTAQRDVDAIASCGRGRLPDHLRLPLVAHAIIEGVGTRDARRTQAGKLASHADVRVRAAALGTLAPLAKEGDARDRTAAVTALVAAIASPEALYAGSAIEAAPALYELSEPRDAAALDAALVARVAIEKDPELLGGMLKLLGTRKLPAAAAACRAALGSHPATDPGAIECLRALGETVPARAEPLAVTPPPLDISTVVGKQLTWNVTTSRGELQIELRPDIAPWAVAAIVSLTRKGFYDGREFHRVVPDFVAQTGDPTDSGWGGPGFMLPAEPHVTWDPVDGYAAGYETGGVGMADAGRDTAGSQWFVMHSRAPHLDSRYTWVGSLTGPGWQVADSLLVGDTIIKATITESR